MSFGWSAGDIAIAIKFVHKVGVALKDSGGASSDFQETLTFLQTLSKTLQHITTIQNIGNDPELAGNLKGHCDHLRISLDAFLSDIQSRFGEYLSRETKWYKLQAASKKIQWAVSLSKKAKEFRDQIQGSMTAISANMLQQTLEDRKAYHYLRQIITQLPSEVQEKVAHTIDTRLETALRPFQTSFQDQTSAHKILQSTSTNLITETISKIGSESSTALNEQATSIRKLQEMQLSHQSTLNVVLNSLQSLNTLRPLAKAVLEQSTVVSKAQAASTDLITRRVSQACFRNTTALNEQTSEIQNLQSTINNRLDSVDRVLNILHTAQSISPAMPDQHSTSELQLAAQNLVSSIWQILWHVQHFIRELVVLLMPYLLVFYHSKIYPLLLLGDHFKFEDALGRTSRLACFEFQQWDVFNVFLRKSFYGSPGLSYVLRQKFQVMNGYNSVPISRNTWATAIQPNCKITMAMLVDFAAIKAGRCADPTCLGRLVLTEKIWYKACPVCGKLMYGFNSLSWGSTSTYKQRLSLDIAPEEKENENGETRLERNTQDGATDPAEPEDVSKFKRLAWQADSSSTRPIPAVSLKHVTAKDYVREEPDKYQQAEEDKFDQDQNNSKSQEQEEDRGLQADGSQLEEELDNDRTSSTTQKPLERLEKARLVTAPHKLHRGMWDYGGSFISERRGAMSQ